jgi:hypothetical protein
MNQKFTTAVVVAIALIAVVGIVAIDIAIPLQLQQSVEAKSICGDTHGGLRNGSNSIICPP